MSDEQRPKLIISLEHIFARMGPELSSLAEQLRVQLADPGSDDLRAVGTCLAEAWRLGAGAAFTEVMASLIEAGYPVGVDLSRAISAYEDEPPGPDRETEEP